jgi:hypothetical protein
MDLKRDKRQNIQEKLDFSSEQTGEARHAGREATESRQAMHEPENPANTIRLMEEVCERENLILRWTASTFVSPNTRPIDNSAPW